MNRLLRPVCAWLGHTVPVTGAPSWVRRQTEVPYSVTNTAGALWVTSNDTEVKMSWRCQRCGSWQPMREIGLTR